MGQKINLDTIKKKQELKELNYQKIEKVMESVNQPQQVNQEIIKELIKLIYKVDYIDKLTWKDRAKQYAVQLGISVGTIFLVLGGYHLITYLIK